jgi:serine phosphatase RsbU (regulator of sigma subunit)
MLATANTAMIGIGNAPGRAETTPFPPGSQLVLYTDGLVERRDRPFEEGIALAVTHVATLPERLDPHQLIDSLLNALIGDTKAEDDIAILVIENTGER